jgi:serine/threonine-protein kinase PknK
MSRISGAFPAQSLTPFAQTIVGESEAMRRLRALIDAVAPTRLAVLIEGPTGSGKELVAAAIHTRSRRRGPFVPFNVCAIGDTMFEDALFGHVRGAFTGAFHDAPGFLREADGGTVFMDEVSGLAPQLQAKLLRAIETGVFRPVGAKRDAQSEFRVIAATNERLDALVAAGRFRLDLSHRLSAAVITVPTLAERLDDVPLLVRHFLDRGGYPHMGFDAQTIRVLQRHTWPGNVRELRHVVEWAAAFSNGHLRADCLQDALARRATDASRRAASDQLEREVVRELLERHAWNTEVAAKQLGVHRATLYRRMKRLGLTPPLSPATERDLRPGPG